MICNSNSCLMYGVLSYTVITMYKKVFYFIIPNFLLGLYLRKKMGSPTAQEKRQENQDLPRKSIERKVNIPGIVALMMKALKE